MSQIKNQQAPNDAAVIQLTEFMRMKEQRAGKNFAFEAGSYLRDLGFAAVVRTEQHNRGK